MGDFDKAIRDHNKAIDLDPEDAKTYDARGFTYGRKGDFDAALRDYNKAIEVNPEYANVYLNRGEVWLHRKDWQKAKTDLTKAKNMGVDIVEAFHNDYGGVEAFEATTGINLPADIAALLQGA